MSSASSVSLEDSDFEGEKLTKVTDLNLKIYHGTPMNFNDGLRIKEALEAYHSQKGDSKINLNIILEEMVNSNQSSEEGTKLYDTNASTQIFFIVKRVQDAVWIMEQLKCLPACHTALKELTMLMMRQSNEGCEQNFWAKFSESVKIPIIRIRIEDYTVFDQRVSFIYNMIRLKSLILRL